MESNETQAYSLDDFSDEIVRDTLKDVYIALEERGYNPINQIVGYLMSRDPGYITSYKDARTKIMSVKPSRLLEVIVKEAIK